MDYSQVHAIVTGGSSGIGQALVDRLIERGSQVSVLALDDTDLVAVAEKHCDKSATVTTHPVDVSEASQVRAAIAEATRIHGPCHLLVTSAGISRPGHFLELSDDHFEKQMAVNYFGTLYAIRAVAPSMIERGSGSIVGVSSAAGLLGVFGYSAYGATKYAVRGLCDVLRTELKPKGIYVGCVYPTDVDTPQYAGERPFLPEEALSISGTVKPVSADHVAVAILKGIDRRRANIFTDPTTATLDRLVRMAPGLTQRWLDHRVGLVTKKR